MTSTVEHLSADQKLARINVKIERAKKHILDLDSALKAFNDASPYERVPQYDSHTGKLVSVTVTHVAPIPDCISTIFGDAIQNLRSALDHLAHQL